MTEMSRLRPRALTRVRAWSTLVRQFTGDLFTVCELYCNSNNFLTRTVDFRVKITLNSIKCN